MSNSFIKSQKILKEALKYIPLGSQTFSRSYLFFDEKHSPLFIKRGINQFSYDEDGNKFLDLINGLGSVSLGYNKKEINNNIIKALKNGITFSLSTKLELQLSKLLVRTIPSAEMVRFGKNGTDVTSAAIRLARYHTGREYVATCGYHGWQDWYIGSTSMNNGVPKDIIKKTKTFKFNKIQTLKELLKKKKFAAVILEPLSASLPAEKFLFEVKKICKKHGAVLIFDEICTAFRVSMGGAQKIYKINPDLTTLGKGIANGMPLAALVGKKEIMKKIDKIFFSGTFAGETLSLQAGISTIKYMKKYKTVKKVNGLGLFFLKKMKKILKKYKLENHISLTGHPNWLFLNYISKKYNKNLLKSFVMQELIKEKILFLGTFNFNSSFTKKDINHIVNSFEKIFKKIDIYGEKLNKFTYYKLLKPIFSVRNK